MNRAENDTRAEKRMALAIGAEMKRRRKALDLRQVDIADVLELPRSSYACLELGNFIYISAYRLLKLLAFFDITQDDLVDLVKHAEKLESETD